MIEDILIMPVDDDFDLARVETFLRTLPYLALEPLRGESYLLADDAHALSSTLRDLRNSGRMSYGVVLIQVTPKRISLSHRLREEDTRAARAFVNWLRGTQPVHLLDDTFSNIDAQCVDNLDAIFGEPA